jgi:hypothetical protein
MAGTILPPATQPRVLASGTAATITAEVSPLAYPPRRLFVYYDSLSPCQEKFPIHLQMNPIFRHLSGTYAPCNPSCILISTLSKTLAPVISACYKWQYHTTD